MALEWNTLLVNIWPTSIDRRVSLRPKCFVSWKNVSLHRSLVDAVELASRKASPTDGEMST